jgi:hypothetical protein
MTSLATDFTPDKRRAMTPARKRRIWTAWEGKCWFCRMPVPESGPGVVYDHVTQLWMSGSDADERIGPIHAEPCNKIKTAADATKRAKVKRILKRAAGEGQTKFPLKSRPFQRTLTKGFDGKVRRRQSSRPSAVEETR